MSETTTTTFDEAYFHNCALRLHINASIGIPLDFLAAYLVIFYSPRNMGSYKYYLLNIIIWSFILDFYLTIIFTPVPLFPALSICNGGIFKYYGKNIVAGIHYSIFIIALGANGVSVICAFLYRLLLLRHKLRILHSKKGLTIMFITHLIYSLPISCLFFIETFNFDGEFRLEKDHPQIYEIYKTHSCFAFSPNSLIVKISLIYGFFLLFLGAAFAIILIYKTLRTLEKQKLTMSMKTYKMHQKLFISLITQILVPIFSLVTPTALSLILMATRIHDTAGLNPWIYHLGATHSILNSLIMIALIEPYRQAALHFLLCNNQMLLSKFKFFSKFHSFERRTSVAVLSMQHQLRQRRLSNYV